MYVWPAVMSWVRVMTLYHLNFNLILKAQTNLLSMFCIGRCLLICIWNDWSRTVWVCQCLLVWSWWSHQCAVGTCARCRMDVYCLACWWTLRWTSDPARPLEVSSTMCLGPLSSEWLCVWTHVITTARSLTCLFLVQFAVFVWRLKMVGEANSFGKNPGG